MKGLKFAFVVIACTLLAPHAGAGTPNDFIGEIADELAERLEGRRDELTDDPDTLHVLINDVLLPRFDQHGFAAAVLREHWDAASVDQQDRFIDSFYNVLLRRYAVQLLEIKLDTVKILPFRGKLTSSIVVVKTRVDLYDGTNASVNYVLVPMESSWRIMDVKIKGISYVHNYRTQFAKEIDKTSFEKLIARLEAAAVGSNSE